LEHPLSYRLPKNRIGNGEPNDPRLWDENIMPVAGEVNSRLNENNIVGGTFPRTRVAQKAYYDFYYASIASDPQIELYGGLVAPDANSSKVSNTGEWELMDGMSLTVPSGEDTLWVLGWAQYGVFNPNAGVPGQNYDNSIIMVTKARLQFAIRIDGTVIESTISGTMDVNWAPPRPPLPTTPKGDNISIHTFRTPGCQSMMVHVHPVRIQCHIPVTEGTHTVDFVVRRIPPDGLPSPTVPWDVYTFNRKILTIKIIQNAKATGTSNNVSVDAMEEGDLMSTANLYTDGLNRVATKMNALSDGNIMRHGLRHEHLPSQIAFPNQVGLTTGASTALPYLGFGFNNANPGGGAGQWRYVNDGASNLETTNGPYDYTANPGFVLILANVMTEECNDPAALGNINQLGVYALSQLNSSGTYTLDNSNQAYVESSNSIPSTVGGLPVDDLAACQTDVPLMAFFDYRLAPPATGIVTKYYVAATSYGRGGLAPVLTWRQSNMLLIHFRK
jgi:hypothetical protein